MAEVSTEKRSRSGPEEAPAREVTAALRLADPLPGRSTVRTTGLAQDLRTKILVLVVASALIPLTAVGVFSFFTAKSIIVEKVYTQLLGQVASSEQSLRLIFTDRAADTEIFATALLVQDSLEQWRRATTAGETAAGQRARSRLGQYLAQVQERFPLYQGLLLLDGDGHHVASTGLISVDGDPDTQLPAESLGAAFHLDRSGPEPRLYLSEPVLSRDGSVLGTFYSISGLEEMWRRLAVEAAAVLGRLRVIDPVGKVLFDSRPGLLPSNDLRGSEGDKLCRGAQGEIAEYRDETGEGVLGTCRYLPKEQLGLLVEVQARHAFAASRRLRNTIFFISLAAALLTASTAWFLVVGMTRPVAALTAGARAVSQGELSHRIPVTSSDQIGYLTEAFNRMTEALQESRAKLERLSATDELTGLFNRRHLAKAFESELSRAERSDKPLSLLMIDLDRFKDFNDRWGHLKGDEFLREAGAVLQRKLRPTDILARYGGEEFVVLMPGTPQDQAVLVAERVREAFADRGIASGLEPRITVSIGVASFPQDGATAKELVEAADGALYLAKQAGRDRVVRCGEVYLR